MEEGSSSLQNLGTKNDHVSIDIMSRDNLASSIKQKIEIISPPPCISRVPEELFKEDEQKYYHPSLISIGPFHHGKPNALEDQKWRYLSTLLSRKPNKETVLDRCVDAVRRAEHRARNFYCQTVDMQSDQFVETMLLDGCFIIELFLEIAFKSLRRRDDPIFTTVGTLFRLTSDLILLENQVPFFILEKLFHLVPIPKQCKMSLVELSLYFFRKLIQGPYPENFSPEIQHLLDLLRLNFLPTSPPTPLNGGQINIPKATNMHSIGIKLKKITAESPLNIKFINGKLTIPSIKIHNHTEILLKNLIAMEQCHPKCPKNITSYAILMAQLIESKRDVRLLQGKNILIYARPDREEEIVKLFKTPHLDINVKDFYYRGICEEIKGYKGSRRRVGQELLGFVKKSIDIRHIYHKTHLGIAWFSLATLFLVFVFAGVVILSLAFLLHHFQ